MMVIIVTNVTLIIEAFVLNVMITLTEFYSKVNVNANLVFLNHKQKDQKPINKQN